MCAVASAPGRPASDNGRLCHGDRATDGATAPPEEASVGYPLRVTANKGSLPIAVNVCQTLSDGTGSCIDPPASSVTLSIATGATPTFSFFVQGQGNVPFDPAHNRIFAVYTNTATSHIVGETSVAVRTQ